MPALLGRNSPPLHRATLQAALTRHVQERTWGHIQQLDVEVGRNCVILRGRTGRYYTTQLAVAAAREVLGADNEMALDLQIEVGVVPRVSEGDG